MLQQAYLYVPVFEPGQGSNVCFIAKLGIVGKVGDEGMLCKGLSVCMEGKRLVFIAEIFPKGKVGIFKESTLLSTGKEVGNMCVKTEPDLVYGYPVIGFQHINGLYVLFVLVDEFKGFFDIKRNPHGVSEPVSRPGGNDSQDSIGSRKSVDDFIDRTVASYRNNNVIIFRIFFNERRGMMLFLGMFDDVIKQGFINIPVDILMVICIVPGPRNRID